MSPPLNPWCGMGKLGDVVTCQKGHPVCEVAVDLSKERTIKLNQFKNWRVDLLNKIGETIPMCPCGEPFIAAGKVCIDRIWYPSPSYTQYVIKD